jgi:hypothetical protein
MHDQFGRNIFRGDTVVLTGRVIDLIDDPNYINCTVLLDREMPPSGMQIRLDLNTVQVTKAGAGEGLQPLPRLFQANSRLAMERGARRAALQAIGTTLTHVRQMLQRLVALELERGEL